MNFIGRAEPEVEFILTRLLDASLIKTQVPLRSLINDSEYFTLSEEVQKHKFDMIIYRRAKDPILVVEVNYKHKEKAAKKWRTIFEPMLKRYGHQTLTINDYECDHLFQPQDYSKHKLSWRDVVDVCYALELSNISFKTKILEENIFGL